MTRRTTCLRCEQEGVVTELVRVGHWGVCPIHSADFLESVNPVPEGHALVPRPTLLNRGIPAR